MTADGTERCVGVPIIMHASPTAAVNTTTVQVLLERSKKKNMPALQAVQVFISDAIKPIPDYKAEV
jgi:hypothetical protein